MKQCLIIAMFWMAISAALADTELGLYLNQQQYRTGDILVLSTAASASPIQDTWIEISLTVEGVAYYYPLWAPEKNMFELKLTSDISHSYLLTLTIPEICSTVNGYFAATLYENHGGIIGKVLREELTYFTLVAPTPVPTSTGIPTVTPTPTPATGLGWISGRAVVRITGSRVVPDSNYDKGTMFSLDGPECQTAWLRHRAVSGSATYQAKTCTYTTAPAQCWDEVNYWETSPCADGNWIVEWGVYEGSSWVNFICPNGTNEEVSLPHIVAWHHITINAGPCTRPSIVSRVQASLVSFEGYEEGHSQLCPY